MKKIGFIFILIISFNNIYSQTDLSIPLYDDNINYISFEKVSCYPSSFEELNFCTIFIYYKDKRTDKEQYFDKENNQTEYAFNLRKTDYLYGTKYQLDLNRAAINIGYYNLESLSGDLEKIKVFPDDIYTSNKEETVSEVLYYALLKLHDAEELTLLPLIKDRNIENIYYSYPTRSKNFPWHSEIWYLVIRSKDLESFSKSYNFRGKQIIDPIVIKPVSDLSKTNVDIYCDNILDEVISNYDKSSIHDQNVSFKSYNKINIENIRLLKSDIDMIKSLNIKISDQSIVNYNVSFIQENSRNNGANDPEFTDLLNYTITDLEDFEFVPNIYFKKLKTAQVRAWNQLPFLNKTIKVLIKDDNFNLNSDGHNEYDVVLKDNECNILLSLDKFKFHPEIEFVWKYNDIERLIEDAEYSIKYGSVEIPFKNSYLYKSNNINYTINFHNDDFISLENARFDIDSSKICVEPQIENITVKYTQKERVLNDALHPNRAYFLDTLTIPRPLLNEPLENYVNLLSVPRNYELTYPEKTLRHGNNLVIQQVLDRKKLILKIDTIDDGDSIGFNIKPFDSGSRKHSQVKSKVTNNYAILDILGPVEPNVGDYFEYQISESELPIGYTLADELERSKRVYFKDANHAININDTISIKLKTRPKLHVFFLDISDIDERISYRNVLIKELEKIIDEIDRRNDKYIVYMCNGYNPSKANSEESELNQLLRSIALTRPSAPREDTQQFIDYILNSMSDLKMNSKQNIIQYYFVLSASYYRHASKDFIDSILENPLINNSCKPFIYPKVNAGQTYVVDPKTLDRTNMSDEWNITPLSEDLSFSL